MSNGSAGVDKVVEGQPQALAVAEEPQREEDAKRPQENQLPVQRQTEEVVQDEVAGDRDEHGSGVVDVDRAHEVPLLALERESTQGTGREEGEPSPEDRSMSAAAPPETN